LSRPKRLGDIDGGLFDKGQIRLEVRPEGRGDATDQRIAFAHAFHIDGGVEAPAGDHVFDEIGAQVLEVIFAAVKGVDFSLIDVKPNDAVSREAEGPHEGQADVSEADDTDDGGIIFDFFF
jgi:hypothetical protein